MPFALGFTDTGADDLLRLIESLPHARQEEALEAVERACLTFAASPQHSPSSSFAPPSFRVDFAAGGVRHYWVATYRITEDERSLEITHLFRVPL